MATGSDNLYLPSEIITDICKRLHVEFLVRFQGVCKDWRNLIKFPSFITEHYDHSALNNPLLICDCDLSSPQPVSPSLRKVTNNTALIGSINGLLCVKMGYKEEDDDPPPSLLLLNPATREVKQVPTSTNNGRFVFVDSGFGYSHVVKDYKIETIHGKWNYNQHYSAYFHEVFSLRTGSWNEVEFGVIRHIGIDTKSVTVNAAMFWLGWHCEDHRVAVVSFFDLTPEVFTLISIPFPTNITGIF